CSSFFCYSHDHTAHSTLSLHDALPIFDGGNAALHGAHAVEVLIELVLVVPGQFPAQVPGAAEDQIQHLPIERVGRGDLSGVVERSEEHTSELQSPDHLVCRLLLEQKKQ